jgi:hypothetical protein
MDSIEILVWGIVAMGILSATAIIVAVDDAAEKIEKQIKDLRREIAKGLGRRGELMDLKEQIAELRRLAAAERTAGPYAAQSVADILHYLIGDVHGIGIFQATSPYPERRSNEVAFAAAAMNAAIPLADRVEALEAELAKVRCSIADRLEMDAASASFTFQSGLACVPWTDVFEFSKKIREGYPDAEGEE